MSNKIKDNPQSDLIYALDDTPPFVESSFAALQHVLASFVSVITPTLIIGGVLGLGEHIPYLISMALIVSGVGTFIQARRIGPIGSGMICLQGTSFSFLGSILAAGFMVKGNGGTSEDVLAMIFGICFFGAFIEIFISQFLDKLEKILSPLITGIVITIIGISLIKVGMIDLAGGFNAPDFGSMENLALGGSVLAVIIFLNNSANQWLRLSSIIIGLVAGIIIALSTGMMSLDNIKEQPLISIPVPFKYGFNFDWVAFIPVALIYLITAIETAGDLTANCMVSKQPIKGPVYINRIKGGILGDGLNSMLASVFNTFPNTTFSQNNGVIQMTGVASRHVGFFIGGLLVLLGLFPAIGAVLQQIPKPVLGGATLVMFGMVAATGIKILANENLGRRELLIMAVSFGVGLGVSLVPELLTQMPKVVQNIFGSAITSGGLTAILLSIILPAEKKTAEEGLTTAEES